MTLGALVRVIEDRNGYSESEVFSVSERLGVVPQREIFKKQIATDDKSKYKRIQFGDIVYNPYLLWNRAVGVCFHLSGCVSPAYVVLRPNDITTARFLHYFVRSRDFSVAVDAIASGSVTRRRTAPIQDILNLEFDLPPIVEQRIIAQTLDAFDKNIELINQMNITLEAIGETLFKQWFVDFEFPNEEGKPYKSSGGEMVYSEDLGKDIPKVWKVGQLSNYGNIVCGKTPPKSNPNYFGGNIPFIKIPDMHNNVFITNTEDSLTKQGAYFQQKKFLPANSILVSCIATVGLVAITSEKSQTNQQINAIIPENDVLCFYLFYYLRGLTGLLKEMGSGGSATLNVNTRVFSGIPCLLPRRHILESFHNSINPVFCQILLNIKVTNSLNDLRDYLLPKLMSGQIRVKV